MPRLMPDEGPFEVILKGVAAGLVGTLVMTSVLQLVARVLPGPRGSTRDPDDYSEVEDLRLLDLAQPVPPTEQMAARLATSLFRTELSPEARQRFGAGIHWAYGAVWGAISAQIQLTLRPPAAPYGVALGIAVWMVGPGRIVPALGLYERPASSGITRRVLAIALHIVYGVTTATTLERLSPPR